MKRDIKRRNSEFHGKPGRDGVVLGKNSCLPRHGNRPDSRESETPDEPLVSDMPHVSRGSHGGSLPQIGISGKDRPLEGKTFWHFACGGTDCTRCKRNRQSKSHGIPIIRLPAYRFFRLKLIPEPRMLKKVVSRAGLVVMAWMNAGSAICVLMLWATMRPPGRTRGSNWFR